MPHQFIGTNLNVILYVIYFKRSPAFAPGGPSAWTNITSPNLSWTLGQPQTLSAATQLTPELPNPFKSLSSSETS